MSALERKQAFTQEYGLRLPKSICTCGHVGDGANSEHAGNIGHGKCKKKGCACVNFTWAGWTDYFKQKLASIK